MNLNDVVHKDAGPGGRVAPCPGRRRGAGAQVEDELLQAGAERALGQSPGGRGTATGVDPNGGTCDPMLTAP